MPISSSTARVNTVGLKVAAIRNPRGQTLIAAGRVLLLVTLLGAPLAFGAVQAWAWGSLELLVLISLLLWMLGSIRQGVLRITWLWVYVPAVLLLVLGCAQYLGRLTLDPVATRESLLKLTTDLVILFLAAQLSTGRLQELLPRFGFVVTAYAFALGLFAILQFSSSNGRIYWTVEPNGWSFGPYVNHNHYAGLMEMLLPVAAAYTLSRPERDPSRVFLGFAMLVPTASLLLSGSRGGLLAFLAEVVLFGGIVLRTYRRQGRRSSAAAFALGVAAAAALFFWLDPGGVSKRLASVFSSPRTTETSMSDRLMMSRDSLRIVRSYPWAGIGLGSFENVYPEYQSFAADVAAVHAHDDYVEALAETGLAGGVLLLVGLVMFVRRGFSKLDQRLENEVGWIQLGATVGCCGLLIHSFADFNFHIPANAAWFCVCAAVATSGVTPRSRRIRVA